MNYSQIIPEAFQDSININPYPNEIPLYNNHINNIQLLGSMMEYQRIMIDIYKRNQQNINNNEINVEQNNNYQQLPPIGFNIDNQNNVNRYPENLHDRSKNEIRNERNENDSSEEEDFQYNSSPGINNGFSEDLQNKENINLNSNINKKIIKKDDEKYKQKKKMDQKDIQDRALQSKDINEEINNINYEGISLPSNPFNFPNPYLNERFPPVYPEEIRPLGSTLFPPNDDRIIAPHQITLNPPNKGIIYTPRYIPLNPPLGAPIYPPSSPNFSSKIQNEKKLNSEEKNKDLPNKVLSNEIPNPAIPSYTPIGENFNHPNEIPFYPPINHNLNSFHEIPFYPPIKVPLHPPHGMAFYPPYDAPSFLPNEKVLDPAHEVPLNLAKEKVSGSPKEIPINSQNDKNNLPNDKNNLPNDKNDLPNDKNDLPNDKNDLPNDKNDLPNDKNKLQNDKNDSLKEILPNPKNEPNDSSQEIPSYPPNGEPLFSAHEEHLYMSPEFPPFPSQGIPPFTPHGVPLHPPHGMPSFHPHGIPLHPPHGMPSFPPHGIPLYPPHGIQRFHPHGIPLNPPPGMSSFLPHGVPLHPPHGIPPFLPHGLPLHPPHGIPPFPSYGPSPPGNRIPHIPPHGNALYPPHGAPSFPTYAEVLYQAQEVLSSSKNEKENENENENEKPYSYQNKEPLSPKKENEESSSTKNEINSHPANQEPPLQPFERPLRPPYEGPFHPPIGEPLYPVYEDPLYPLPIHNQEPLYPPPYERPLYPPYEGALPPLYPPIQEPLYPPYQGSLKHSLEEPFSRNPKEDIEIPSPKIPIENNNSIQSELNSKNPNDPNEYLHRGEIYSESYESKTVVIDVEPCQENPNINKIHPPKNSIPKRKKDSVKVQNHEEQSFPQLTFNPPQNQMDINIPLDQTKNNQKKENIESSKEAIEDEKDCTFNSNNGEIYAEQQYYDRKINNYDYQLNQLPYQGYYYYPPPYEYNEEGGYYPVAYPSRKNNKFGNEDINMPLNELEYNNSQNQFTRRRIKRLYTGNNNTILEVNEENNKPTLILSENSKNQEIQKNLNQNNIENEENRENKDYSIEMKDNKEEKEKSDDENKKEGEIINEKNKLDEKGIKMGEQKVELAEKKLEVQKINNYKEINYEQIPLYIDTEINRLLIDEESQCPLIPRNEENIKDADSFPIIIINEDKIYNKFIHFIETNFKYREFNHLSILKKKLILPRSSLNNNQYQEYHNVSNENIKKFSNITNSLESSIYDSIEINNIFNSIKDTFNKDNKYFYDFINKWIHILIDLMVEFIQFKLKKISYFYYCNNCHFAFLYISDSYIEQLNIYNNNNDLQIVNNSINIFEDLMKVIDIHKYNNKNNKNPEFMINVIYYEEEYNYINLSFEEEINGIFIPCSNMKSFDKAMIEIHDKNIYKYEKDSININTNNDYMFELIIAEIYVDKILNYLINNNYFQFFKGICILINEKEDGNSSNTLLQIKKKYAKYTKDLFIAQNDIIAFLKKEKEDVNYRNNKKYLTSYPIIDYTKYLSEYYKLHQGASFYYNKYSINSYQIIEKVFKDFLIAIDNFKKRPKSANDSYILSQKTKKNIKNEKKILNIIKLLIEIKDKLMNNANKEIDENIKDLIQNYINDNNSFNNDFNYWLNKLDKLAHQKFCYFIGSLMYNLDNSSLYYQNENYKEEVNNDNNGNLILYKELSGNYIDLLLYQKNLNQIISFPSFLFCFEKNNNKSKEIKSSKNKDKYQILYRINYNLNNQNEYLNLIFDLSDAKIFQLFTFYRINDIKITNNNFKAIIDLEPINKKIYLENQLKENNAIYYNPNFNIMDSIYYEDNLNNNNNSNINQSYFSNSNDQSNIYITSSVNTSKFLIYFNNQFNKNLTTDMTSLILENSNLKNFGLKLLSKINFKDLVILNLDNNKISDLSPLKDCNFQKLKKLSFGCDGKTPLKYKIKDISPLTGCNFPDLFILNLKNNLIEDISYLLFMNFPNLIILDLSYNQIKSIHVLSKVNFPKLENLDLCNNQIDDITPLINTSGKKNKIPKNIENNKSSSSLMNSVNISNLLSKSRNNELLKKNVVLPSLKILKIKHNKLNIDEGFLMTVKALRNRGVTIFK